MGGQARTLHVETYRYSHYPGHLLAWRAHPKGQSTHAMHFHMAAMVSKSIARLCCGGTTANGRAQTHKMPYLAEPAAINTLTKERILPGTEPIESFLNEKYITVDMFARACVLYVIDGQGDALKKILAGWGPAAPSSSTASPRASCSPVSTENLSPPPESETGAVGSPPSTPVPLSKLDMYGNITELLNDPEFEGDGNKSLLDNLEKEAEKEKEEKEKEREKEKEKEKDKQKKKKKKKGRGKPKSRLMSLAPIVLTEKTRGTNFLDLLYRTIVCLDLKTRVSLLVIHISRGHI
jgi:hypothetical protein